MARSYAGFRWDGVAPEPIEVPKGGGECPRAWLTLGCRGVSFYTTALRRRTLAERTPLINHVLRLCLEANVLAMIFMVVTDLFFEIREERLLTCADVDCLRGTRQRRGGGGWGRNTTSRSLRIIVLSNHPSSVLGAPERFHHPFNNT